MGNPFDPPPPLLEHSKVNLISWSWTSSGRALTDRYFESGSDKAFSCLRS